jgi:hypothetical protein
MVRWRRASRSAVVNEFTSFVNWGASRFFEPTPEEQNVVLVNTTTLREAERLIDQTRLSECPASWAENRGALAHSTWR